MRALIRSISPAINRCELTHLERVPLDVELAIEQHAVYVRVLEELGCRVIHVEPEPDLPDAVFVEDTAVVVEELAILTRPGAASRRPELPSMARTLREHRELVAITAPGTLDGGDVLRIGRDIYVGRSARSNDEGIAQLADALAHHGYRVIAVEVDGCLHLKSAVTQVGPATLLIDDACVDRAYWPDMQFIAVDPGEPGAANALLLGGLVIHAVSAHETRARMERAGLVVRPLDVSEIQKAEGGVTCCSVLLDM
jgi:dimethylargininase